MLLMIPVIAFAVAFALYYRYNKRQLGPIGFFLLLYLGMALTSIAAEALDIVPSIFDLEILPVVYLCVMIMIPAIAFGRFKSSRLIVVEIENISLFKYFGSALIAASCLSILFFAEPAMRALIGDTGENRNNIAYGVETLGFQESGLVNSVASLFAGLFFLNIIAAHLCLSEKLVKKSYFRRMGYWLLLSSVSYIVYILAYVGRDGFVYWTLTFVSIHLTLRGFLSSRDSTLVKRLFVAIFLCGLLPFTVITLGRFKEFEFGIFSALIGYFGGQVQMFNDYFLTNGNLQWGRMNFPIFCDLLSILFAEVQCDPVRNDLIEYYLDAGVVPWVFATYLGSWIFDFGIYYTPIIVALYFGAIWWNLYNFRRSGSISLSSLIIFILLLNIATWGVFYFRHYALNYSIAGTIIVALLLKITSKRSQRAIISLNTQYCHKTLSCTTGGTQLLHR